MSTLGKAVVEYSADTAKFISDVGRAAVVFDRSMSKMEQGIQNLRNALVTAATAGGLGLLVKSAIDAGDQLNKLSQKSGIAVESLSALKFGAELADVNVEALTIGLKEFNKSLAEANDENSKAAQIFKALGVDIRQGPEVALRQFADAISKLPDGITKSATATEILGKAGANMIPFLNQGARGMDEAAERARRLGLIVGPDFAAKAEQFNDNLKTLGKTTDALGISLADKLVPGLTSLTENLVKASEKGNLFLGILKEIVKLDLALLSKIPGPIGAAADAAAERLFANTPGVGAMGPNATRGKIRRPEQAPPPPPNADALACAVSGGKWVNGRCVRPGDDKDATFVGRQLTEGMAEEARLAAEAAQNTDDFNATMRERQRFEEMWGDLVAHMTLPQMREYHKLRLEIIDAEQAHEIVVGQLQGGFDGLGNALATDTRLAQDLGFTFASAFEEAIVTGKKLREVVQGLGQDIARIIIRRSITEPLGNSITDALARSGIGALSGGLFNVSAPVVDGVEPAFDYSFDGLVGGSSGFAVGTDFVPRTGLALVHQGEQIIPADEARQGGVMNQYTIQAVDAPSFVRLLSSPAGERTVTALIERAHRRNGRSSGMRSR